MIILSPISEMANQAQALSAQIQLIASELDDPRLSEPTILSNALSAAKLSANGLSAGLDNLSFDPNEEDDPAWRLLPDCAKSALALSVLLKLCSISLDSEPEVVVDVLYGAVYWAELLSDTLS